MAHRGCCPRNSSGCLIRSHDVSRKMRNSMRRQRAIAWSTTGASQASNRSTRLRGIFWDQAIRRASRVTRCHEVTIPNLVTSCIHHNVHTRSSHRISSLVACRHTVAIDGAMPTSMRAVQANTSGIPLMAMRTVVQMSRGLHMQYLARSGHLACVHSMYRSARYRAL